MYILELRKYTERSLNNMFLMSFVTKWYLITNVDLDKQVEKIMVTEQTEYI